MDLSNNKIVSLGNIYAATSLRTLLLENNEIDNLPAELSHLSNLQTLSLHGNPQRTVRQAVLQKGVTAILAVGKLLLQFLTCFRHYKVNWMDNQSPSQQIQKFLDQVQQLLPIRRIKMIFRTLEK
jgi:Leucine-rich repeat (LRR) protein